MKCHVHPSTEAVLSQCDTRHIAVDASMSAKFFHNGPPYTSTSPPVTPRLDSCHCRWRHTGQSADSKGQKSLLMSSLAHLSSLIRPSTNAVRASATRQHVRCLNVHQLAYPEPAAQSKLPGLITPDERQVTVHTPAGKHVQGKSRHQQSVSAAYYRGGTSRAILFERNALGTYDDESLSPLFRGAIGSPDSEFGRQLDGMGGGISSLSKVGVVGRSSRETCDVDFTFAAVGIRDGDVDFSASCGSKSMLFILSRGFWSRRRYWHQPLEIETIFVEASVSVRLLLLSRAKVLRCDVDRSHGRHRAFCRRAGYHSTAQAARLATCEAHHCKDSQHQYQQDGRLDIPGHLVSPPGALGGICIRGLRN